MRLSGWAGLAALAAITALFCLSGKLIVAAFEKIPPHLPRTYPALGALPPRAPPAVPSDGRADLVTGKVERGPIKIWAPRKH